jgi:acetoin utilization deacetylase AcuC-like enzyme
VPDVHAPPLPTPLTSRYFTSVLKAAAGRHAGGRLLAFHEGGYSEYYVPFCGLAVMEEMAGVTTQVCTGCVRGVCQGCVARRGSATV